MEVEVPKEIEEEDDDSDDSDDSDDNRPRGRKNKKDKNQKRQRLSERAQKNLQKKNKISNYFSDFQWKTDPTCTYSLWALVGPQPTKQAIRYWGWVIVLMGGCGGDWPHGLAVRVIKLIVQFNLEMRPSLPSRKLSSSSEVSPKKIQS